MGTHKKWRHQFQLWKNGQGSEETVTRLIKRHKKLDISIEIIQSSLSELHVNIDHNLLDPQLLPIDLLLHPENWDPVKSGVHRLACLNQHSNLTNLDELLSSGIFNQILKGECPLYKDIPPIPIKAYLFGMHTEQRRICRQNQLSAFEHLATEGWKGFRNGQPIATGFDRYHQTGTLQLKSSDINHDNSLLILEGDADTAQSLALQGGWNKYLYFSLNNLEKMQESLDKLQSQRVTICHAKDIISPGAHHAIAEELKNSPEKSLFTCDDVTMQQTDSNSTGYEHRQYRSSISAWRLYTRGGIGGLLTVPTQLIREATLRNTYSCMEAFRLDLLLGSNIDQYTPVHCHQPLVRSNVNDNPALPEQGWPAERKPFGQKQLNEITTIRKQHARKHLTNGGSIRFNPLQHGSHDLICEQLKKTTISILIPFRDQTNLTSACVNSIKKNANTSNTSISYEIKLIDNGSAKLETKEWVKKVTAEDNITCLRLDEEFNFARINNEARKQCRGDFLLFLNNDIEFISENILQDLLDPFAHPSTAAVGARLKYPDGSIQHNGVIMVPGERRSVLQPGKHLKQEEIIESLIPLQSQEEFSAASAACLMVKAEAFDAINGFDEKFAVVFNDVDLCLRLREAGGRIIVTPHPEIVHHESISRGKDLFGTAWARHQRESGRLHLKHKKIFLEGDPLTSRLLHHHSNRYEPASTPPQPLGLTREKIKFTWKRNINHNDSRPILIFAQHEPNPQAPIRKDIIDLLGQYRKNFYIQVVAATPEFLYQPIKINQLKKVSDAILIRDNEGYDFGSWMTGIQFCRQLIEKRQQLLLCNDSLWGPIHPLDELIKQLNQSQADVLGLTDDLMYAPHLQSPMLMFKRKAIACTEFWDFWDQIHNWEKKRSIVKNYEVGLSTILRESGLKLESLYTNNSYGNVLHAEWKSLIVEKGFPFLKVSLLRDNPHQVDISDWEEVIGQYNKRLAKQIAQQLEAKFTEFDH